VRKGVERVLDTQGESDTCTSAPSEIRVTKHYTSGINRNLSFQQLQLIRGNNVWGEVEQEISNLLRMHLSKQSHASETKAKRSTTLSLDRQTFFA
jgi:hypothetical protein